MQNLDYPQHCGCTVWRCPHLSGWIHQALVLTCGRALMVLWIYFKPLAAPQPRYTSKTIFVLLVDRFKAYRGWWDLFPSSSVAGGTQSGLYLLPGDFFPPVPCGVLQGEVQKSQGSCTGEGEHELRRALEGPCVLEQGMQDWELKGKLFHTLAIDQNM